MGQQDCNQCPVVRAENARLRAEVVHLQRTVQTLRDWLADAGGRVAATVRLIDREREKRTMPLMRLVEQVRERLISAYDASRGR